MALLEIRDLQKRYAGGPGPAPGSASAGPELVLDLPAFDLEAGEEAALAGGSGSGKSTLLHLIAGLLTPERGSIAIDGTDVTRLSEARRDAFRATHIGYVFQAFHLLEGYTALENVLLGLLFGSGSGKGEGGRERARELLVRLGLADRTEHRPSQLSIGQKQRVAVARALANRSPTSRRAASTGGAPTRRSRSCARSAANTEPRCWSSATIPPCSTRSRASSGSST